MLTDPCLEVVLELEKMEVTLEDGIAVWNPAPFSPPDVMVYGGSLFPLQSRCTRQTMKFGTAMVVGNPSESIVPWYSVNYSKEIEKSSNASGNGVSLMKSYGQLVRGGGVNPLR